MIEYLFILSHICLLHETPFKLTTGSLRKRRHSETHNYCGHNVCWNKYISDGQTVLALHLFSFVLRPLISLTRSLKSPNFFEKQVSIFLEILLQPHMTTTRKQNTGQGSNKRHIYYCEFGYDTYANSQWLQSKFLPVPNMMGAFPLVLARIIKSVVGELLHVLLLELCYHAVYWSVRETLVGTANR